MTTPTCSRFLTIRYMLTLAVILVLIPIATGALTAAPPATASSLAVPASPVFLSPLLGSATLTSPAPKDFAVTCNVHPNSDPGKAAGQTLAPGVALHNNDGCGQALLYLNDPASGHFQASLAVSDAATASSTVLRLFLLAPGGALLRTTDVKAVKGKVQAVDFDVAGGVTLAFTFPTQTESYIYRIKLTGTARARAATSLSDGGMPVGGAAVPVSALQFTCNAAALSQATTVSALVIPTTRALQLDACSKITVQIPSAARGALTLRYGQNDSSDYSSLPTQVGLRVLDAAGHLLRKAIGLTYLGSGLQPIWVNLAGASTVTFTIDAGNSNVSLVITGLSFLPSAVAPHYNPDRQDYGSPSGAFIPLAPNAVFGICNAILGTADLTVNRQLVPRNSYLSVTHCGVAELIMTNATGIFSARLGVSDATDSREVTAHLVVLDQNSKPLVSMNVMAHQGQPGALIRASIRGASIVQISFTGNASGVLYDMQLSGHATLYDRVFPPSEPPVSTVGGVAIDPREMAVSCNVHPTTLDMAMIHQAALEQWSLYSQDCGSAVLKIAALHGPHTTFSALYGIALQDQAVLTARLQFSVLNAQGKTLRHVSYVARSGYGPRRAEISLAGGSQLVITGTDAKPFVVFAMTLS